MHPLTFYFLFLPLAAQANLFKCTDSVGKVTYTNTSCAKAGLKEAKILPPPPPPALDATAKVSQQAKTVAGKTAYPEPKPRQTAALQVMKSTQSNSSACAKLNEDLGKTMDEMDAARSQGSTAKKQAEWNIRLDNLQTEKNRLGCF
jgi:hypothetical protein